jgi:hypothetical protein
LFIRISWLSCSEESIDIFMRISWLSCSEESTDLELMNQLICMRRMRSQLGGMLAAA